MTYPIGKDHYEDVRAIFALLVTKVSVLDNFGNSTKDSILAIIPSDKFIPITVLSESPTQCPLVNNMFTEVPPHLGIREAGKRACELVCPKYLQYVQGAFVSTIPQKENLEALRDKMAKTPATLDMNPVLFRAVLGYLLHIFKVKDNLMLPSIHPSTPYNLKFNPNAGAGFKHFNIPEARTKRTNAPIARRQLENILSKMQEYIGYSEYLIPPMVHNYTAKPEVRAFDGDMGKIRLIGMVGQMHDMITKMVDTPFMVGFRRWSGCMIGSSIWSSLQWLLMYHLRIGEWNRLPAPIRAEFSIPPDDPKQDFILWTADASGQDVSFTASSLFAFLMVRYFWVDTSDKSRMDVFNELFAFESASANAKIVQWFGRMWYLVLGIMTSGYHTTSDMDCLMLVSMILCAVVDIMMPLGFHPKTVMDDCLLAVYGDDIVGRMPIYMSNHMGIDESGFPKTLAAKLQQYGVTLKRGETKFYKQTRSHKKKFFTRIVNDEVVSEGIHMLQRYFVKYDINMNPLHPDSNNFAFIMPWRVTNAYATRLATDAQGFKGKLGREDSREMNEYLSAYVKAFGLLLDAGPNKVAHKLIKAFMSNIAEIEPRVPKCAHQVARGSLTEVFRKLGCSEPESVLPAVGSIYKWNDDMSYNFIVAKISVAEDLMDIKNPYWKWRQVADIDEIQGRILYRIKDGEIIQLN